MVEITDEIATKAIAEIITEILPKMAIEIVAKILLEIMTKIITRENEDNGFHNHPWQLSKMK